MTTASPATQAERLLSVVIDKEPDEPHPKSRLAHLCGISQSAVYQWYSGTKDPKGIHIATICDYFSVSSRWVFLGDRVGKIREEIDGIITKKKDTEPVTQLKSDHIFKEVIELGNAH